MNEHAIEFIKDKQLSYRPIYSLNSIELETKKAYIKTYQKNGFIWPSKLLAEAAFFFDKKHDGSIQLCVDYLGLNNLKIKSCYSLLLIGAYLDRLDYGKWFI